MKKTNIVATIGPASSSVEMLSKLLPAGLNIMRMNFSHGDFPEHQEKINNLKAAMANTGLTCELLQDLGGPKIRIGSFTTDTVMLVPGHMLTLTTDTVEGTVDRVSVNYPLLPQELKVGDTVFVNDGKQRLIVREISGNDVKCEIVIGGTIKGKRGINLPDSDLSVSSLTEKDIADLEFGISNNVDYIALSFVRQAEDIHRLREMLNIRGVKAKIIAKIETPQAIRNIDAIIDATDGIMVARGDLAVEVPFEKVPTYQKMMIKKANAKGKFVIVATQMMLSMMHSPVPSRAEVSDVANAVWDGADAVMLSEESAQGDYPLEAVSAMARICEQAEADKGSW